jgi:hypothetical protein
VFDDYVHLSPFKEAANLLANFDGWARLNNEETLKINEVPSVAAVICMWRGGSQRKLPI